MTSREEVSERACQCAEYGVLSQQAVHQEQDTGTNADNRKNSGAAVQMAAPLYDKTVFWRVITPF